MSEFYLHQDLDIPAMAWRHALAMSHCTGKLALASHISHCEPQRGATAISHMLAHKKPALFSSAPNACLSHLEVCLACSGVCFASHRGLDEESVFANSM